MAKLKGNLKMIGKLGDYIMYPNDKGDIIMQGKGGASKERFRDHPKMELNRLNSREFVSASKVAGQIRKAFRKYTVYFSDADYFNRLSGLLAMIGKLHPDVDLGKRNPFYGNMYLLENFEWNAKAHLDKTLNAEYTSFIDAKTGIMQADFDPFVPLTALKAPPGATHFQLFINGIAIHPEEKMESGNMPSRLIPLNSKGTERISLQVNIEKGIEEGMLLLGVGVIFYEENLEVPYAIRGGACSLARVEKIHTDDYFSDEEIGPEGNDLNRLNRQKAHEIMMKSLDYATPKVRKGDTPMRSGSETGEQLDLKIRNMDKLLWLQKIDKYRHG